MVGLFSRHAWSHVAGRMSSDETPIGWQIVTVIVSMLSMGILSVCLLRRVDAVRRWSRLPITSWLCLAIYVDSMLFVFLTAILRFGTGITKERDLCDGAIVVCLVCYVTTKVLIYCFLIEKAYIVSDSVKKRSQDKAYLFNMIVMLVLYTVIIALNFAYRFAYINDSGQCIIGMQKVAMLPLIGFDVVINVYLTALFVIPLRKLYSYKVGINTAIRTITIRTFFGCCGTLISSIVNLTALMILDGEKGWICLLCCNADVLFSVIVLHWVTAIDSNGDRDRSAERTEATGVIGSQLGEATTLHSRSGTMSSTRIDFPRRQGPFGNGSKRVSPSLGPYPTSIHDPSWLYDFPSASFDFPGSSHNRIHSIAEMRDMEQEFDIESGLKRHGSTPGLFGASLEEIENISSPSSHRKGSNKSDPRSRKASTILEREVTPTDSERSVSSGSNDSNSSTNTTSLTGSPTPITSSTHLLNASTPSNLSLTSPIQPRKLSLFEALSTSPPRRHSTTPQNSTSASSRLSYLYHFQNEIRRHSYIHTSTSPTISSFTPTTSLPTSHFQKQPQPQQPPTSPMSYFSIPTQEPQTFNVKTPTQQISPPPQPTPSPPPSRPGLSVGAWISQSQPMLPTLGNLKEYDL